MTDYFETGKQIVREDATRPAAAYRRVVNAIESAGDFTMCDRDLLAAAMYAIRTDNPATALVALGELELRMAGEPEPGERIERRAA